MRLLAPPLSDSLGDPLVRLRQGVDLYPDDATMWYTLGEALVHGSDGLPTRDEIERAFAEAIRIEPNRAIFYNHAIGTAIRERNDTAHARELVQHFAEIGDARGPYTADFDPRVGPFVLRLIYGSPTERAAARAEVDTLPPDFLTAAVQFVWAPEFAGVAEQLLDAVWARGARSSQAGVFGPNRRIAGIRLARLHALWRGNVGRALEYDDGAGLPMGPITAVGNGLLYYMYGIGLPVPRARLIDAYGPARIDTASTSKELFHAGALAVDDGRGNDYTRALQILQSRTGAATARRARALDGYAAFRRGDLDTAITLLEQSHNGIRIALWWLGDAYRDAGRWADAERVFGTSGWNENFEAFNLEPLAQQRLGTVYEAQGRFDEALDAYGYFLEHWADADAEVQPLVAETRARVGAILERRR